MRAPHCHAGCVSEQMHDARCHTATPLPSLLQAVGLVWDVRLPTEAQKQLKLKTGGSKGQPAAPIKAAMVEARPAVSDAAMAN